MKDLITYDQFLEYTSKLEIQIGQIIEAERVPKSHGLKLKVHFGVIDGVQVVKTCFTNLGKTLEPKVLLHKRAPFFMNVEASTIKGVLSEVVIIVGEAPIGSPFAKEEFCNHYSLGTKLL